MGFAIGDTVNHKSQSPFDFNKYFINDIRSVNIDMGFQQFVIQIEIGISKSEKEMRVKGNYYKFGLFSYASDFKHCRMLLTERS